MVESKKEHGCLFCELDESKIENTVLYETDNFKVVSAVGSLVDGYVLIVSKRHVDSMAQLNSSESKEYVDVIMKFREMFKSIYGRLSYCVRAW